MPQRSTIACPEAREIAKWLALYGRLRVGDTSWAYRSFTDLVVEHGLYYPPAPWPQPDLPRPGECFRAAIEWADRASWTYVEGFTLAPPVAPFTVFEHA